MNRYFETLSNYDNINVFRAPGNGVQSNATLHAAEFDISTVTGFLPHEPPLASLKHVSASWETAENLLHEAELFVRCDNVTTYIKNAARQWIAKMEHLSFDPDILGDDVVKLRRAHVVLSFLNHIYIHVGELILAEPKPDPFVIPKNLAMPWVWVSRRLQMPPILTYADTVLWNWRLIDESKPLSVENMAINTSFTGTETEKAFYMLSLLCEAHSPDALRCMMTILDECFVGDDLAQQRIAAQLVAIQNLLKIFASLFEASIALTKRYQAHQQVGCDNENKNQNASNVYLGPTNEMLIDDKVFYNQVRNWLRGGRWEFQGCGDLHDDEIWEFGGPSAGQSTMIHAIDVFLGVDHQQKNTTPEDTFMARMSYYMPGPHREFLVHLQKERETAIEEGAAYESVRALIQQVRSSELVDAYNSTLDALIAFRNAHMHLVATFIISPARRAAMAQADASKLKGTGGTSIVSFLKQCKINTSDALVE